MQVSFMELLAMEMKAEGKYVARGLSFKWVLCRERHACAQAWLHRRAM